MISYLANDPLYPLEFFELFVKKILKLYESLVDFVKVAGFYVIAGSWKAKSREYYALKPLKPSFAQLQVHVLLCSTGLF